MHRQGWTVCVLGILLSGSVLISLSANVLSADAMGGAFNAGSSRPRRVGTGARGFRGHISREELQRRRHGVAALASRSPHWATDCDGMMQQQPSLPPAPDDALSFITIGDWGVFGLDVGSDAQLAVSRGMACVARKHPPRFIASLGDNFYPNGVTSVDDAQFEAKFEAVYHDASLHVPWYPSLGDHDHCGDVGAQAAYSRVSTRWTMPRAWYTRYVKIPGGQGGTMQLVVVDWVALEGSFTRAPGDRRFHDKLSAAAGPEAAVAHWEWLREVQNPKP